MARVAEVLRSDSRSLYERGLLPQEYQHLKYRMLDRKPAILVLGSSRVMQIEAQCFEPLSDRFLNAGGLIQSVVDIAAYSRSIKTGKVAAPKVILLGVDPWWFKRKYAIRVSPIDGETFPPEQWSAVARVRALRSLLFRQHALLPALLQRTGERLDGSNYQAYGLAALIHRTGFRADGSRKYPASWMIDAIQDPVFRDREIPPVIDRIRLRKQQFSLPAEWDDIREEEFMSAVRDIRSSGSEVIVLMPPVSIESDKAIRNDPELSIWWDRCVYGLSARLRTERVPIVLVRVPPDAGFDDLAMIDGFHPGAPLMGAMVRKAIDVSALDSILRKVDNAALARLVAGPHRVPFAFDSTADLPAEMDNRGMLH